MSSKVTRNESGEDAGVESREAGGRGAGRCGCELRRKTSSGRDCFGSLMSAMPRLRSDFRRCDGRGESSSESSGMI
jgi:hypothetical protein